jgi:hypothetical protein
MIANFSHLGRRSSRSLRGPGKVVIAALAAALAVGGGCSNFFGPGPDPAADGRVDGGLVTTCNPLQVLDPTGNSPGCGELYSCLQTHCDQQLRACFGNDYQSQQFVDVPCQSVVQCEQDSGCNSNSGCVKSAESSCATCLTQVVDCEQSSCQGACNSQGSGGNGSGGNGSGGSGGSAAITLVPNVQVTAIALDSDTVYFANQQGLAKVGKDGSGETGLGGFPQVSGLALDANNLYVVNPTNNSLLALGKSAGGRQTTLATWMCGGGSGSLALDSSGIYLTSGSNLFDVPIAGGSANLLASDVSSNGGGSTRIALDDQYVYYVASDLDGGVPATHQAINAVAKAPTLGGAGCGNQLTGMHVADVDGSLMAMSPAVTASETVLFFTDLTSNGLAPTLELRAAILPMPLHGIQAGTFATLQTATNSSNPSAGNAIAADPGGGSLYVAGFDGIYRVACNIGSCGTPQMFVPGADATALAFDGQYLYYGDQSGGVNPPGLRKIAK